jgi:hypothetical protein
LCCNRGLFRSCSCVRRRLSVPSASLAFSAFSLPCEREGDLCLCLWNGERGADPALWWCVINPCDGFASISGASTLWYHLISFLLLRPSPAVSLCASAKISRLQTFSSRKRGGAAAVSRMARGSWPWRFESGPQVSAAGGIEIWPMTDLRLCCWQREYRPKRQIRWEGWNRCGPHRGPVQVQNEDGLF